MSFGFTQSGGRGGGVQALPATYKALIDGDSFSSSQIWSVSSTNNERRAAGWWTNFAAQSYQLFDLDYAAGFGTSGHQISQMVADQDAALQYAIDNNVSAVFVTIGTNDVEATSNSIATLTADYTTFLEAYAELGVYIFVGLPQPRGDWEGELEATRANFVERLHDIRSAIQTIVSGIDKCYTFDTWDLMVDPEITNATNGLTYYPLDGYIHTDGVHFFPKGAHYYGKACLDVVKRTPFWTAPKALPNLVGAYNANPGLTGTGGSNGTGSTGDVADDCRVERAAGSNLVLTCSKETTTIFGISQLCQKIVLSGATASGEEGYFYLEYPEPTIAFDGTTGVELVVPIRIENVVGMNAVYLYGRVTQGSTYTCKDMTYVSGQYMPDDVDSIEWLMKTEPITIPSGSSTRHQMLIRMPIDGTVSSAGCTVWIGQPSVKQITI